MRIKLGENIPASLVPLLRSIGHDADTVAAEGLAGHDDATVWNAAQRSNRFLITQDLDFSDIRLYQPGTHHGQLIVRLSNPGREALTQRVAGVFQTEDVARWEQCFEVVTDRKIRIRRPGV